ncbi:copper chaperone PCu(A)C [Brevibacterium aurantiacum]|uniref:Copper chaperone PCu(A)C n=1 Tax=Brevibacterium aurantiacum TaxID=273384 RepID=A0A2A3X667_BREAU|nr:copper chaperone PCu(A)C [Brevibacterium aurantiacum]AZU00141.1 copper chaperone PCu(A)C [Brevibacterium linens]AZL12323.1 copper chaperone PCu(A)C [Brevibacterium aurantiacum]AZT96546.1 copper chaperone PCu(A)C [Brevibacterium aurantiacum]PCC19193.1 copper chaperone PCu(A)C [Brevibacterium aurantiacum]
MKGTTVRKHTLISTAIVSTSLLLLSACGGGAEAESTETSAPVADSVEVTDAWVKAADDGMSAAFGSIENTGSTDATVVSAESQASTALELHETVENESGEMVMREKENGFTITAGQSLALEPGGNHIMLMDLTDPIKAGDEVEFTLTFSDDSTLEFSAPVKDYEGANENYESGDDEAGEHEGHDMEDMDHSGGSK